MRPYSSISIFLSCILLLPVYIINHQIAQAYSHADGKTRALFGLTELTFSYQYIFTILSLLSLVFICVAIKKKENKYLIIVAAILMIFSTTVLFGRIWIWMT
jgi:cytochrome c biogenesis protein CcdA